ncbi:MAG: amino acid ABC transporter permease, partial [Desulfuromonas sp.]
MSAPAKPTREYLAAPISKVGPLAWIKANLFNSWYNSALTIVILLGLFSVVQPFFRWA